MKEEDRSMPKGCEFGIKYFTSGKKKVLVIAVE